MMKPSKRCLLFILFLLPVVPASIRGAEPKVFAYGDPVKLTGTIVREFDMSFVDSDLSPLQDPKEVAAAVAKAKSQRPDDESGNRKPVPHLILRLDRPISVQGKSGDPLPTEMCEVSEIDLGGWIDGVRDEDIGKTRFIVSGTLWHAETVHHLRSIMMKVTGVAPDLSEFPEMSPEHCAELPPTKLYEQLMAAKPHLPGISSLGGQQSISCSCAHQIPH